MGKEIYLAGKVNSGEVSIAEFATELEERGHRVLEKWWEKEELPKPYMDHGNTSMPAAEAMINAAYHSEVFVLFPEDNVLGAAVELGAALASTRINPEKRIVVVNPFEVRQSVFYVHPRVLALRGIDRIRKLDWY